MKILDSCNTLEELIGFSKQPGQNTWGFIILSRFKTPTFQIQCLRIHQHCRIVHSQKNELTYSIPRLNKSPCPWTYFCQASLLKKSVNNIQVLHHNKFVFSSTPPFLKTSRSPVEQ